MAWPNWDYFASMAKQYAIELESYPEDNEEHKKKIFIALLKFSRQIWYAINSNEDFQKIKKLFQTMTDTTWGTSILQTILEKFWANPQKKTSFDSKDKLILKQLENDIQKYYAKMWAERLLKKQTNEDKKRSDDYETALKLLQEDTNRLLAEDLKTKENLNKQHTNERAAFEKIWNIEMSNK